ncbi:AAA family ATPase [Vibrio sp. 14N.309.X.WAT.E.F5]|uniref:AAA family ATPase n=1 Tax=Vibrio sp. 14N.309.X.WAT.E.F5 TaxID=2998321 RepID=UPI0025AF2FB7|nr:AAA family ATPase [Vibrio sp. 14N.309.X.WAT.E.F5]MDN2668339.1 AAA family ATPase [Vibrio sp. 14N.309.X.WAT.E.F5]
MKVIYLNQNSEKYKELKELKLNFIALWSDNWDDYDYKTTLNANAFIDGKEVDLPRIKILFDDIQVTFKYLNDLLKEGWDGYFPLVGKNYVSLPVSMDFYELLIGHACIDQARTCAEILNDASYSIRIKDDESIINLSNNSAFSTSLLRDRSAGVALQEGWRLFNDDFIEISNFSFDFDIGNKSKSIPFDFETKILPHEINVLIGPNGCGKSQTLHKMVSKWLDPSLDDSGMYSKELNVRKLIVVSYSPFELFPVDLNNFDNISDKSVYNYFGLRRRSNTVDKSKNRIKLSRSYPQTDAVDSILNCVVDDIKFNMIKDWSNKIDTVYSVLNEAIEFDSIAIEITNKVNKADLYSGFIFGAEPVFEKDGKRYIKISNDTNTSLNIDEIRKHVIKTSGVCFFKKGKLQKMSSGQRLFSYIVINILGSIKKNSLIIVDEPELFLHPTLEIEFVSMLKKILKNYFSKAILATHSLVTVREVPKSCVHVFKKELDETYINNPPFETFGGDIQRISSYVFGDKSTSKPYEAWIKSELEKYGSAKALIDALGRDINEEMIVQIHAMDKKEWF